MLLVISSVLCGAYAVPYFFSSGLSHRLRMGCIMLNSAEICKCVQVEP